MHDAQVVGRFQRSGAFDRFVQQALHAGAGVGKEAENLAEVRLAGLGQQQPVRLGAGEGLFVRVDLALAKAFQPHAGHESAASERLATAGKRLVVDVQSRLRLGEQHPFAKPVPEELGGAGVAVVGFAVARLVAIEDQPHDVGRVLLVEIVLQGGPDDVVRRGDHIRERAHVAQVVADSAKGLDFWHGDTAGDAKSGFDR